MRFGLDFTVKAVLVSALLTQGAAAQTSSPVNGQPTGLPISHSAGDNGNSVQPQSAAALPVWTNAGTLAETADTTALATSTYHQPTGFLPGMKP